ncbi:MAG: diaminopimelate epimerase [Gammaproteobacteria bacterium]
MRELRFSKMHSCGNDFVVIDAVRQTLPSEFPAAEIASRRRGVGCDQILILERARGGGADFNYRILNADGGEVGQCGNGARCVHAFLRRRKLTRSRRLRLRTKTAEIVTEDAGKKGVRAYLGTPVFAPAKIPLRRKKEQLWYSASAAEGGMCLPGRFAALSLGNPHAIFAAEAEDIVAAGEALNDRRKLFPEGVNAGFCRRTENGIFVRVYERGAGETPSCGSGAAAAAAVFIRGGACRSPLRVTMRGGELLCGWRGEGHPAWLQGGVHFVFDGALRI